MRNLLIKKLSFTAILLSSVLLSSCGFFDKDNTPAPSPLVNFTPLIQPRLLWSTNAGSGVDGEYLKMGPAVTDGVIYTASVNGRVTAVDKLTGHRIWQVNTGIPISASPAASNGLVIVTSRDGDVIALHQINGSMRWHILLQGEILARPAINSTVVVIKTIDGYVRGLSRENGREMWSYHQEEPSLILRGASAPLIRDNQVFVGFKNGTLAKLNAISGDLAWSQSIAEPQGAFSIERMIDIDADPISYNHRIYAATYQGKIAALDWQSGKTIWARDISSYTGMTADDDAVFISDAKSHVWSFGARDGAVNFQQNRLYARNITGPASMGRYIVVGDKEGYLHWLTKEDGTFAARTRVDSAVYASPVVDQGILYVLSSKGKLFAYSLG